MTPTTTIGTPDAVFIHSGPKDVYLEHRTALDALGGNHTYLGEDLGRAAAYDAALLGIFWTSMAGYAHALALAKAEGVSAGVGPVRQGHRFDPPAAVRSVGQRGGDSFSGEGNPITSAASSMAHIIHASETHGIDAGAMRPAEGLGRRTIGLGHGTTGSSASRRSLAAADPAPPFPPPTSASRISPRR